MLIAISTVQAMFRPNPVWYAWFNTFLRTASLAYSTPDTCICDTISFHPHPPFSWLYVSCFDFRGIFLFRFDSTSQYIRFPENRGDSQMKILDLSVSDFKDNPNISCLPRIDISQVGLFGKNQIHPFFCSSSAVCFALEDNRIDPGGKRLHGTGSRSGL